MKVGVLGAGISGLSVAKLLADTFEVEILERNSQYGGIAKTKDVDGTAYHVTGGHCFNSKYTDVLDFVFNNVLPKDQWHMVSRKAVIKLKDHEIPYPIEFAIKQIHDFDPQLAIDITKDFLNTTDDGNYQNLEEWFRKKFGNTLAEEYFIPYNKKIWNKDPAEMSHLWVEGKLPMPNKNSFFKALIGSESDTMPHAHFYYPNSNDQNTFINELARGLDICLNFNVNKIELKDQKWVINGIKEYDILISTLPLNILPALVAKMPLNVLNEAKKLRYNKVTTMLWETKPTSNTWTYIPGKNSLFHRYIHIGSFFKPVKNFTITEAVGEKSYSEMVESGLKDDFLIKPVGYHVSDHAYVVFDDNYATSVNVVKTHLNSINLYTLGRFGEWEYYNMDICIKSSIDIANAIKKAYKTN